MALVELRWLCVVLAFLPHQHVGCFCLHSLLLGFYRHRFLDLGSLHLLSGDGLLDHDVACDIGYRFEPTEQELLLYYLYNKVNGTQIACNAVMECDLYGRRRSMEAAIPSNR
ncbi:hypothetical protein M0R45_030973 [Rubus argutus]|uniref:NAC domain-containing protein n=1 Tax=Rubus argutus TaxID=59490 RepID=A0AAW1WF51_RUBAR